MGKPATPSSPLQVRAFQKYDPVMPEMLATALCPCGQEINPRRVARLLLAVSPGKKIRNGKFHDLETSGERIGDRLR